MMYCVITEILKVKLEKKNCPYSPIAQLGRTYSTASSLSFIVWISMLVTAKMIRLRFLPSSSHVSGSLLNREQCSLGDLLITLVLGVAY